MTTIATTMTTKIRQNRRRWWRWLPSLQQVDPRHTLQWQGWQTCAPAKSKKISHDDNDDNDVLNCIRDWWRSRRREMGWWHHRHPQWLQGGWQTAGLITKAPGEREFSDTASIFQQHLDIDCIRGVRLFCSLVCCPNCWCWKMDVMRL